MLDRKRQRDSEKSVGTLSTTWEQRFREALALLSGGHQAPADMVVGWFDSDDERLQQWASEHGALGWHQGIALIEAAELLADTPAEGEGHLPRAPEGEGR